MIRNEEGETLVADEETLQRAAFTPHLWVIGSFEIPFPIFAVAICGEDAFRDVALPRGIASLPEAEQERIIRFIALQHFNNRKGSAELVTSLALFTARVLITVGPSLAPGLSSRDRRSTSIRVKASSGSKDGELILSFGLCGKGELQRRSAFFLMT